MIQHADADEVGHGAEALGIRAIESVRFSDLVKQYSTIFNGEKSPMTIFREASYVRSTVAPYFKKMLMEDIRREDIERYLSKRVSEGIPELRWHDLRHVFAVTAARAGVSLGDLMKILGHSSLIMSMRYAHHAPANSGDLARTRLEDFLRGGGGTVSEGEPERPAPRRRKPKAPTEAPKRIRQEALPV